MPIVSDGKAALAHLFTLEANEISKKWFAGNSGRSLRFRLVERRPERQLDFAECRDRVERDLRSRKQEDLLSQLTQTLQRKYKVVVHEKPTTQPEKGRQ